MNSARYRDQSSWIRGKEFRGLLKFITALNTKRLYIDLDFVVKPRLSLI
jgi:hypothetical protein